MRRLDLRDDRGSATLELAVLGFPLLALLGLVVFAGRVGIAHSALDQAARDAARSASLSTPAKAKQVATDAARATLQDQGLSCSQLTVTVDVSGFATPLGQPAQVSAHVECQLAVSDLAVPGMPGNMTLTADMSSPLDEYRTRP